VSKIPRGKGFDKRSINRHLKALEASPGLNTSQYARRQKLQANALVEAFRLHFPERWERIVAERPVEEIACSYCDGSFVPNRAGQEYCSPKCARDARTDESYFGGKRREAVGLSEGVCQLCGSKPKKGLQAHHLYGKDNDPENAHLLALCSGCHSLVTMASRPLFLREPEGWERLRRLVELRVQGQP
jgi:hypothetical protein